MDYDSYLRFALALIMVLGLIGLTAWGARRLGLINNLTASGSRGRRLSVVESAAIDTKRRLVLIRRDQVEHLILLGPDGNTVIETDIKAQPVTALPKVSASS